MAIRALAQCYQNHINKADGLGMLRLVPPADLELPPLKIYTYIPVTQSIIVRQIADDSDLASSHASKAKGKDKGNEKSKDSKDGKGEGKNKDTSNEKSAKTPKAPEVDVKGEAKADVRKRKHDDIANEDDLEAADDDDMDDDEEEVEEEDEVHDSLHKLEELEKAAMDKKSKRKSGGGKAKAKGKSEGKKRKGKSDAK